MQAPQWLFDLLRLLSQNLVAFLGGVLLGVSKASQHIVEKWWDARQDTFESPKVASEGENVLDHRGSSNRRSGSVDHVGDPELQQRRRRDRISDAAHDQQADTARI